MICRSLFLLDRINRVLRRARIYRKAEIETVKKQETEFINPCVHPQYLLVVNQPIVSTLFMFRLALRMSF